MDFEFLPHEQVLNHINPSEFYSKILSIQDLFYWVSVRSPIKQNFLWF